MTSSLAKELLGSPWRVVAEAVRGGDDEAVVDEAPAAPALLRPHLDPRHPRPHVDGVIPLHYLHANNRPSFRGCSSVSHFTLIVEIL